MLNDKLTAFPVELGLNPCLIASKLAHKVEGICKFRRAAARTQTRNILDSLCILAPQDMCIGLRRFTLMMDSSKQEHQPIAHRSVSLDII